MLLMMSRDGDSMRRSSQLEIEDLANNVRVSQSVEQSSTYLGPHFQPGPWDVICARGSRAFNHEGNRRFRDMVKDNMEAYKSASTKLEKSIIVSKIVDDVRTESPHGGFIKEEGGQWYVVTESAVREKVGQMFRDLLHTKYRSSTKAKRQRKLQRKTSRESEVSSGSGEPSNRRDSDEEKVAQLSQVVLRNFAQVEGDLSKTSSPPMGEPEYFQPSHQPSSRFDTRGPATTLPRMAEYTGPLYHPPSFMHHNSATSTTNQEPIRFEESNAAVARLDWDPFASHSRTLARGGSALTDQPPVSSSSCLTMSDHALRRQTVLGSLLQDPQLSYDDDEEEEDGKPRAV